MVGVYSPLGETRGNERAKKIASVSAIIFLANQICGFFPIVLSGKIEVCLFTTIYPTGFALCCFYMPRFFLTTKGFVAMQLHLLFVNLLCNAYLAVIAACFKLFAKFCHLFPVMCAIKLC